MILLLDLMGLAAGEREGMREEAFRGNCKIMVVHYVTVTGSPGKMECYERIGGEKSVFWGHKV